MERTVRGFKFLEVIARGGMAVVYKAVQTSVDRIVAVKELHQHLVQDSEFIDRFRREATAAANLHHENIIIIHDYGAEEHDGKIVSYIIAMEYVEGKSLKDLLTLPDGAQNIGKKLPIPVALNIFIQICRGLEHAHNKGVVHRDIKPANIILANDGYVKIADFGLAHSSHLPSMTVTGATLGTPAYMSPEQAAGNRKIDARADIFSLGVVMYEMVTGIKPFLGETYPATITKILTFNPEPVTQVNPSVPQELGQIIDRCICKDVDKRYANVTEVLKELQFCAEKNNITVGHHLLREFVKNPDEFEKKYNTMIVKQFMDKGLYYMNLGFEKIDDAIQMFSHILQIQPDNALAREYLEKLNNEKKKIHKPAQEKKTAIPVKPEVKSTEVVEKKRKTGAYIAAGVLVAVIAGGVLTYLAIRGQGVERSTVAAVNPAPGQEPPASPPERVQRQEPEPATTLQQEVKPVEPPTPPPTESAEPGVAGTKGEMKPEKKKESPPKITARKPEPKTEMKTEPVRPKMEEKPKEVVAVNITPEPPKVEKKEPPALPTEKIEYSYLMVKVNPWADVYVDGKLVARTPLKEPIQVVAGEHTIKLVNPEFSQFEKKMNFKPKTPDKPLVINISLESIGGK
jgi:serine/threonine protein kinase